MKNKIDELLLILSARARNPQKYKRNLIITNHGNSHYSIEFDKSEDRILKEIRNDYQSIKRK